MGGRIWVEGEPGRGTEVHFTVRMDRAAQASPALAAPGLRDLPVLVVDDNASSRRILEKTLRRFGALPMCVPDAGSAMAVLQGPARPRFGALLVDAVLPDADGLSFVKQAASLGLLVEAPVVVLGPARDAADGLQCRRLGVKAVLLKPVSDTELVSALEAVLRGDTPSEEAVKPALASLSRAVSGATALVVDDNSVNLRVAVRLLEKQGYRVVSASSGEEALAVLSNTQPGVILMDVQMPGMDGFETTRRIRAVQRDGVHLPIIALTANAMKGDRERCLQAGMDGYLAKPIDRLELLAEMERLLSAPVTGVR
jgi:CheY-like chemotaxis protein